LRLAGATLIVPFLPGCASPVASEAAEDLVALEARVGGRLGVSILDTASNVSTGHRADQRFGMCSTFKLALAGIILREADQGRLSLDQSVAFSQSDMVPNAPVVEQYLPQGAASVRVLAEAAQTRGDNVATNLLLNLIGGPAGFTARLRDLGDNATRLDRLEPEMNLVPLGEVRDTTTPRAMARTTARLLTGEVLSETARDLLVSWTIATTTGAKRIRAGLPADWRAGDKTGTGIHESMANKYNDVAIAWPPRRAPIVIAAYYEAPGYFEEIRDQDQAVLAEVGAVAARWAMRR
jgi:beta-lactamase class A